MLSPNSSGDIEPPLIELRGIVKKFRSTLALDNISLDMGSGVTGLLGPNGAGKSTLIKVLLGLIKVTSGTGRVLDFELGKDGRAIRQFVGYMPEEDCYIPGMTGIEVVRFAAELAGLPAGESLRRAHEILDFCGMEQERYRNIDTYSTGMRQKAKFASAIVHDPKLLILDEPTSGLDPEERESFLNRIRVLARDHDKAVMLSTHILPDVQSTCQHVIIVARGRLRKSDSLENLSRPASPTITVQTVEAADEVVSLLRRVGREIAQPEPTRFTLEGELQAVSPQIWSAARQAGVAIRSIQPARNSLEQIFIDSIQEADHAHV